LTYFAKDNEIYLGATLDDDFELAYVGKLRKYCREICTARFHRGSRMLKALVTRKPFSVCAFYNQAMQAFVDHCLEVVGMDAVFCYCSSMAEYVFRSRLYRQGSLGKTRLIIDFVDLDSDKWAQYRQHAPFPAMLIYALEEKRLREYEMRINRFFDASVFVASREIDVFKRYFPGANNVSVVSNGVDSDFFAPQSNEPAAKEISANGGILLFTGVMDYFANVDGVNWFCEKVLYKIRQEYPGVEFLIVGKNPVRAVKRLSRVEGVSVTGYVPEIRKYYWTADVCVIPLRIARGLQNKVLEAMAAGLPVVATSNASEGILCNPGDDIVIADGEDEFASAVVSLLSDRKRRERIGARAMDTVHRNYSWDKNMRALTELLLPERRP
jgi:sugar transferase (PEP-CTERM/EpsH1 system associated)